MEDAWIAVFCPHICLLTGLLLVVMIGAAVPGLAWNKLKALRARSWPMTQEKIEFGTVIEKRTRYFSYYMTQMAYSYAVNGEYFSGYYEKYFLREGNADKFAEELKGKPAFVRHKRNSPDISTLLREDQQCVWSSQS